jgi:hypothetical protein
MASDDFIVAHESKAVDKILVFKESPSSLSFALTTSPAALALNLEELREPQLDPFSKRTGAQLYCIHIIYGDACNHSW